MDAGREARLSVIKKISDPIDRTREILADVADFFDQEVRRRAELVTRLRSPTPPTEIEGHTLPPREAAIRIFRSEIVDMTNVVLYPGVKARLNKNDVNHLNFHKEHLLFVNRLLASFLDRLKISKRRGSIMLSRHLGDAAAAAEWMESVHALVVLTVVEIDALILAEEDRETLRPAASGPPEE
ncbi:hypothetical protein EPO33_04845 [Patescibacteria group bacterium]|nr:MAG: hypothetical protein EPO33_04845 [Patescibacteria group bacterium]